MGWRDNEGMEVNTEGLTPWTGLGNPSNLDTCAVDLQTGEFSFVPPNVLLPPLVAILLNEETEPDPVTEPVSASGCLP